MAGLYASSKTLYDLFEDTPKVLDSFIIFHDGLRESKMSYNELAGNVEMLSTMLADVSSHEVIGCLCRPHILQPVFMLSILKCSSAFTFLDLKTPISFLKNLQKHMLIRTLLAEEKTLESLKSPLCSCWQTIKSLAMFDTHVKILYCSQNCCSSSECTKGFQKTSEAFYCHQDLAYVIQTSGTTGEAKVVQVPHQCIVPNIIDLRFIYSVNSKDVILLCSPLTFDPSIVEIFLALSSSATLVIVSDFVKSVPKNIAKVVNECSVTIMQATPSLLQSCGTNLIQNEILTKNTSLRILSFGGERCPSLSKLSSWKSAGNETQFFNLYGITEVSCWATVEKISFEQKIGVEIPLGKPLLDTDIEVRNENDEVINEGFGQLFIGGLKRWCVLNSEPWPLHPSRLMRPTGDLVYSSKDGSLHFEGRQDSLVKYHGKKFSLCPLNKIIEKNPEVSSHYLHFNREIGKLYVFLVLNENLHDTEDKIRCSVLLALQSAEPNIPPVVISIVPFIPITAHGKTDHKRLVSYVEGNFSKENVFDRTSPDDVVKCLRILWQGCTGNNAVGDDDHFVLNGGDSVSSVQFALEVEWKFHVPLPGLVEVLLNSSFKSVCKYVVECLHNASLDNTKCKKFTKDEGAPFNTITPKSSLTVVPLDDITEPSLGNTLDSTKCKKFKKDEEISSGTITTKSDHVMAPSARISSPSLCYQLHIPSSYQSLSGSCHQVFSRREKKLLCFCGKCFSSESKPQQLASQCKLFLKEEFTYNLEKCIDASPCCCEVIGSHLFAFIGSHSGYFVALDIIRKILVWKQTLPDRIESSACLSSCGSFVLVGCYDHFLYCFSAQSGEIKWKYKTNAEVKCSPIVSPRNIAYVGSHDHHLYAVHLNDGRLMWKAKISNGSIFSSPVLCADNAFLCAATLDGVIASLNPDTGEIFWKYSYTSPLFSSPLNVKSNIFIGSVDGSMLHFSDSGKLVGKYLTAGPIFSSASYVDFCEKSCEEAKDYIVFGSHDCNVYCYSTKSVFQWKFSCSSAVYATPFSFSKNGQSYIAVACTKGTIYVLNAHDGNICYSINCPGEIFSSPVVINDYLVIGCRDNNFYCFKVICHMN